MANGSTGEDMSIFEILDRCGRILLGVEDMGLIYTWNGSAEFGVWQHAGHGKFYQVDFWTTDVPPRSLESAMDRCRERLSQLLADEGSNEFHDAMVDKRRARQEARSP